MEAFTSGKVSHFARKAWMQDPTRNKRQHIAFDKISGGWRMIGWESEIDMARAFGRGTAAGSNKPIHPFDKID